MKQSNSLAPVSRGSLLDTPVKALVLRILFVVLLVAECSFFFLSFVPIFFLSANNYQSKYLTSLLAVVGIIIVLLLPAREGPARRYAFGAPILLFVAMCFAAALSSANFYQSSLGAVMSTAHALIFVPLLYFVFHDSVYDDAMYRFVVNATIAIACIYAALCFLQAAGFALMNPDFQNFDSRNGRLRLIMSGDFVAFGAVLALGCAFKGKRNRWVYVAAFLLLLLELFWVAQTRFLFVGLAFAALVGFVIKGNNRVAKVVFILLFSLFAVIQYSDAIYSTLFPQDLDFSSRARLAAYQFFPTHAADMGIFGIGFIPNGSPYSELINVNYAAGRGGIDDIGIVEYYARFGVAGIAVLIFAIACFILRFKRSSRRSLAFNECPEAWMVLAFFLALMPTMAITDPQRIFFLPYLVILIEHALGGFDS